LFILLETVERFLLALSAGSALALLLATVVFLAAMAAEVDAFLVTICIIVVLKNKKI